MTASGALCAARLGIVRLEGGISDNKLCMCAMPRPKQVIVPDHA